MSIPDQSIECLNPNCGRCIREEKEREAEARASEAALLPPGPPAPPMPPWSGKQWTEFGYQTREQYENRLEWERTARDLCQCTHLRQEHGPVGCLHASPRPKYLGYRLRCECPAWTERVDSDGLSATGSDREANHG